MFCDCHRNVHLINMFIPTNDNGYPPISLIAQVPELLIYDETQYVVDRLDEVMMMMMRRRMVMMMGRILMKSFSICRSHV